MDREPSSTGPSASPEVVDDAFLALRNRDRRFGCYFLLEHERASISKVTDVVTGWIHASGDGIVEPQCREQRQFQLLHTHVPKLVDAGIVRHDEDDETLSLDPCPEPLREFATRACAAETGSKSKGTAEGP